MLARTRILSALAALVFGITIPHANAQVHEAATGSVRHLWAGGEFSDYHTDYDPIAGRLLGIGVWGDYYIVHRIGVEAEARFLTLNAPAGQTQKDYLIGPTVLVYQHRKFYVNAHLELGGVFINYPYNIGSGSYFAYVPGGNVEYRLSPRLRARAGYEFQFLPSAPGYAFTAPRPSNGLTPSGFNIGISYRIF